VIKSKRMTKPLM